MTSDNFRVGDLTVVRGESGTKHVGRLGKIKALHRSTSAPSGLHVWLEFKEGDELVMDSALLERVNLQVFIPGDFVTLTDIEVHDDEGKMVATSGDPAIVIEHDPYQARLKIGLMKSPDDRPFETWIDDRLAAYRMKWDHA